MFLCVFRMPKRKGDELSEYELKRIENINRNLNFLEQLGMLFWYTMFKRTHKIHRFGGIA